MENKIPLQDKHGEKRNLSVKQEQIEWRRIKVLELLSQGCNQTKVCQKLQLDKSTVNRDVRFLRRQAARNLHKHIQESIPEEYQKCLVGINQVLDITWNMVNSGELDNRTKLQALALVNDCNKYKMDLATGSAVCNEAIKFVTQKKEQLNKLETLRKVDERIEELEEEEADKTTTGVF